MSRVLGIIAEYNPFHNGHKYHISKSKEVTGADYVIAVISGNFVQRGDTSIVDKWTKAEMALEGGADLVIELPTVYSVSSAENFAEGAIKILDSLGIVDTISFGTETDDIMALNDITDVLCNEPKEYTMLLSHELKKGNSFPKARDNALQMYLNDIKKYSTVLSGPNNILAIEYLKAMKRLKSNLRPVTIQRAKVQYYDENIVDEFASATGIRKLIQKEEYEEIEKVMDEKSYEILMNQIKRGRFVVSLSAYEKEIIYTLRRMRLSEVRDLPDVTEGLENNIKSAAASCNNLADLINMIKSKRYTQTRIQRILIYALLGITKRDMDNARKNNPYIRVLGFNENGKKLISIVSKNNPKLKVITSVKKFADENNNRILLEMLSKDIFATDVYTIGYEGDSFANQDYTKKIVTLEE